MREDSSDGKRLHFEVYQGYEAIFISANIEDRDARPFSQVRRGKGLFERFGVRPFRYQDEFNKAREGLPGTRMLPHELAQKGFAEEHH